MIAPDAIPRIAKHLFDHPEGVCPRMAPRGEPNFGLESSLDWYRELAETLPPQGFVEATGRLGDVYLLHPLMMHSASRNTLRVPRIITNPPVSLKEPMCFQRGNGDYSLVERKTMQSLGGEELLRAWRTTMPRESVVPERVRIQEEMRQAEARRLQSAKVPA